MYTDNDVAGINNTDLLQDLRVLDGFSNLINIGSGSLEISPPPAM